MTTTTDTSVIAIADEYAKNIGLYESFCRKLKDLIEEILDEKQIAFHIVESRAKSVEGFKEKITRSGKKYPNPLKDIPDICGCRIITYYHDDVPKVADIIKAELKIIEEELSHQQEHFDADRFGYLSAHYIVKIGESREYLSEWGRYKDLHAEIQIRSVVQHAWSAVSHLLQYKNEIQIPSALQRRLYRIAGLFELADEEFVGIRNQRANLVESAKTHVLSGDTAISLSSSSLEAFTADWFQKVAEPAFSSAGFKVRQQSKWAADHYVEIYELANESGVYSIKELAERIDFDIQKFAKLIHKYESETEEPDFSNFQISPSFALLLVTMRAFAEKIDKDYIESHDWSDDRGEVVIKAIKASIVK